MKRIDFKQYQDFTHTTNILPSDKTEQYLMTGLASEVGELCSNYAKRLRDVDDETTSKINYILRQEQELGDICWFISEICTLYELRLDEVAQENMKKLKDRQKRDKIKGDGDDR
jgi:NTP pyrophosphatase (non-canonical NTP hydrolase)